MSSSESLLHSTVSLTRGYWNVHCTCAALQRIIVYSPNEYFIIIVRFTYRSHLAGWRTTVVM